MPQGPAARVARMHESGTVKITEAAARLRAEGRDIISLSMGEPDFDTPKPACEALKRAVDEGKTRYVSAWGIPPLREAIATKSQRENGIPCSSSNVMVTPAKQAVMYAILGLVEPGDEVIMADPSWVSYAPLVALAGGQCVSVPTHLDEDFRLRPDALSEAVTNKTRLIVHNSPSNPTGAVSTPEDVAGMADIARDHDLWVLSDELYEKIIYDGRHVSPASLDGMAERTLTINGFSKAYAMTGWRMGWMIGPQAIMKQLIKLQQHSITHPAAYSQYGALAALQMDQSSVSQMREAFRQRRDHVVKRLQDMPGWHVNTPPGAFYVFPRYDGDLTSLQAAERLLVEGGVAVTPGSEFGACGESHLRLSYATSLDNLDKALDAIARVSASW